MQSAARKTLLPQHQSTVSKDIMADLFASHQKMISLEQLKKRTIHGHNAYSDLYLMMMMIMRLVRMKSNLWTLQMHVL